MHHLKSQHNPSELLALSLHAEGRISHRFLAIRDILLKRSRHWICEQYGIIPIPLNILTDVIY